LFTTGNLPRGIGLSTVLVHDIVAVSCHWPHHLPDQQVRLNRPEGFKAGARACCLRALVVLDYPIDTVGAAARHKRPGDADNSNYEPGIHMEAIP